MGLDSWRYGSVALFLGEDNTLGKTRGFIWAYIKSGNVSYVSSVPEIVENLFPQSEGEKSADPNVLLQK
jgi:hypothetical protein